MTASHFFKNLKGQITLIDKFNMLLITPLLRPPNNMPCFDRGKQMQKVKHILKNYVKNNYKINWIIITYNYVKLVVTKDY
jgi:hypothetical protein